MWGTDLQREELRSQNYSREEVQLLDKQPLKGMARRRKGVRFWHVVRVPPSTLQPAELHLRKGPGTTSPTQRANKAVTVGLVPDTLNPRTKQLADQLRRSGSANQATDGQDSSCVKSLITREPEGSGPK